MKLREIPWSGALLALALASVPAMAQQAIIAEAQVPAAFGNDHDDPRIADPGVPRPDAQPCGIEIVDHGFDSFEPARGRIDAPGHCPGPWQRIVLELEGTVEGRQYDRIGHLDIGGVTVFRTSTPEPSREGIAWRVEKDLTGYAALLATPQALELHIGNVVNETYTGVFRVKARLVFYPADAAHPAGEGADVVMPLSALRQEGAETVGMLQLPVDAERLVVEVYATGSGGGCEEFWYFAIPESAPRDPGYWCRAAMGPYREVQLLVDGRIAGVAAPYPHIYTGGWSNPFLWYAIPAPRAFDIAPVAFELTPFIGAINDGKAHEVRLRVLGVVRGSQGWTLLPNAQVWRDPGGGRTQGELLEARLSPLDYIHPVEPIDANHARLQARATRRFVARGVLRTSRGTIETRVERELSFEQAHRWDAREDGDDWMRARWHDTHRVASGPQGASPVLRMASATFGLEGGIATAEVEGRPRLTTTLAIEDDMDSRSETAGSAPRWIRTRNRFDGSASYTQEVPREQRRATARSSQAYTLQDSDGHCLNHLLRSVNGRFIEDRQDSDCGLSPSPPESATP